MEVSLKEEFRGAVIAEYSEELWEHLTKIRLYFGEYEEVKGKESAVYLVRHGMAVKNF